MSYSYVSAKVLKNEPYSYWEDANISLMPMFTIFQKYKKAYVKLTIPNLSINITLDLDAIKNTQQNSIKTFNQFLIDNGNTTLPDSPNANITNPKYAYYSDAFRARYKIKTAKLGYPDSSVFSESEKKDLFVTRAKTDMGLFYNNCMVSVNGFFHQTSGNSTGTYVLNGAQTMRKCRQNQMGLLSFLDIAPITQIPITSEMIFRQAPGVPYSSRTTFKLPMNIDTKTVFLVLGGYLLIPNQTTFWQVSSNSFNLNISELPLLERYYESRNYLDLSSLNLPVSTVDESLLNVDDLTSDATLLKYFQLSQSFFVVINTTDIFTNKFYIKNSGLPGMFTAYKEPKELLLVNNGRVGEYWKTEEDGYWAVNVVDSYLRNNVFASTPYEELQVVSDNLIPHTPFYNSRGFFLEIGKQAV